MNDDWQKKEKKEKKKKKEAEASDTGGDAGSGGEESGGGGGGGAPKKPVGNVFALFNQGQIQEFKEVWANTIIKLHYRHLPPSSPTIIIIIIIFIISPYYRPPVAPVAAAAIWCLAALLRLAVQLYCTDIFNLYTLNTILSILFIFLIKSTELSNM